MMADTQKQLIRTLVDSVYDVQSTRISMGNRIVAALRTQGIIMADDPQGVKEGLDKRPKGKSQEEKDKEDKEKNRIIMEVLSEYKAVTKAYIEKYDSRGNISKALRDVGANNTYVQTEFIYKLVGTYVSLADTEKQMSDICAKEVQKHPLWDAFFKDIKGCGPLMSASCIAYLDPYAARYASSFWRYCGLDVVVDENGTHGRGKGDTYEVDYIDKYGKPARKRTLGYNPKLKSKVVEVLGSSFLKVGRDTKYAQAYYDYRNRLENRPDCNDLKPVVMHRRAMRYMAKLFLQDLWVAWRTLEGLPVGESYAEAMLHRAPHHDPRNTPEVTDEDVLAAAAGLAGQGIAAD